MQIVYHTVNIAASFFLIYISCVCTEMYRCTETLAESNASRLWIMFQGAMPIATTRTLEEVLAKE